MGMEKENKTLETLLTLPISRTCIIAGKMAGASVVAVIMTIVYMIGFRYYMVGIAGNIETSVSLKSLGLVMTPGGYTVLGVSLFLAILSALSLCIILGVFVQDAKSAQTMSLPVSLLVMIPFVISMFKNIGDLPILPRIAIYLIPFSHPIIASRLLIFGDYLTIIGGMLYMIVFIAVMMWVASVLFRKDILLTARARFIRIRGKR
jgi:ABC-2 type transport system permease protein